MQSKLIIGVDVSKDELDYVEMLPTMDWSLLLKTQVEKVANEEEALNRFLASYCPRDTLIVFEPTGTYSDKLQSLLVEQGFRFALVNPKKAHYFSQSMGLHIKTDQTSARLLAYMGSRLELPTYRAPSEELKKRKQLLTALCSLEKERQRIANQLHAQTQYRYPHPLVIQTYQELIEEIVGKIEAIEKALDALKDEAFEEVKKLAMSIKGIGPVTARWLLVLTNNLQDFQDARQLVKYCGLSPKKHYSGSSVRIEGGITKQASSKLRAALYMGAKSAIRYNAACKDLYQRLRKKGKSYYKAMVAVMAKLLKQAFGVIKSGKEYEDEYYLQFQKN